MMVSFARNENEKQQMADKKPKEASQKDLRELRQSQRLSERPIPFYDSLINLVDGLDFLMAKKCEKKYPHSFDGPTSNTVNTF